MTSSARALPPVSRQRLVQYFFFATFLFLLWQVIRLLAPFYVALLGSAILALLVFPAHHWILERMPRFPSVAAGLSTAGVVLTVVMPILLLGWTGVKETARVYPVVQNWLESSGVLRMGGDFSRLPPRFADAAERARRFVRLWNIDPQGILLRNLDDLSRAMTGAATRVIKNALFMTFNLLVLTFTLFFFLRDGPFLLGRMIELVPMAPRNKASVIERLQVTLYAVIRGVLVVAVLQGLAAGGGFAIIGVPFPVLLGMLIALLAFIPFVGPAFVWIPVAVGLGLNGEVSKAVVVALWGGIVVSGIDNFARPLLISADAKLPLLFMFFGMLGGLRVYGPAGILLGPVTIGLLLAFIDIYRREYDWLLNPDHKPH